MKNLLLLLIIRQRLHREGFQISGGRGRGGVVPGQAISTRRAHVEDRYGDLLEMVIEGHIGSGLAPSAGEIGARRGGRRGDPPPAVPDTKPLPTRLASA